MGIIRLDTSVDGMEFLGDHIESKKYFRQLEAEGVGLYPIDVWIHTPINKDRLLDAAKKLQRVTLAIRNEQQNNPLENPNVTGIVGVHSIIELFNYRLTGITGLPGAPVNWKMLPDNIVDQLEDALKPFWHKEKGLRLSLLTTTTSADIANIFAKKFILRFVLNLVKFPLMYQDII